MRVGGVSVDQSHNLAQPRTPGCVLGLLILASGQRWSQGGRGRSGAGCDASVPGRGSWLQLGAAPPPLKSNPAHPLSVRTSARFAPPPPTPTPCDARFKYSAHFLITTASADLQLVSIASLAVVSLVSFHPLQDTITDRPDPMIREDPSGGSKVKAAAAAPASDAAQPLPAHVVAFVSRLRNEGSKARGLKYSCEQI